MIIHNRQNYVQNLDDDYGEKLHSAFNWPLPPTTHPAQCFIFMLPNHHQNLHCSTFLAANFSFLSSEFTFSCVSVLFVCSTFLAALAAQQPQQPLSTIQTLGQFRNSCDVLHSHLHLCTFWVMKKWYKVLAWGEKMTNIMHLCFEVIV